MTDKPGKQLYLTEEGAQAMSMMESQLKKSPHHCGLLFKRIRLNSP